VKIKICGLSRDEDIDYVNEAAPDYIGFVFAPSKRQITERRALELRIRLRSEIIPAGVFVNAGIDDIARLYDSNIISIAQLHGDEDAAYIAALKERAGIPVIKAVKAVTADSVITADQCSLVDFVLFDSGGGSGKTFDWRLLDSIAGGFSIPYFLAGGIGINNIDAAIKLNPFCIDVSSGVETGGVKNHAKIIELVKHVHSRR
jgi:phosphoribosylanthranilate isomerase